MPGDQRAIPDTIAASADTCLSPKTFLRPYADDAAMLPVPFSTSEQPHRAKCRDPRAGVSAVTRRR
jgi:hypothetical protein